MPFKQIFDDIIAIIDTDSQFVWIISLDARQRYDQVSIRLIDRENLAFFVQMDGNTILK